MGDPLRQLFDRLRADRFPVGPDQYLRMRQLVAAVGDEPPERLKTLIAPIFAGSKEQQSRFYDIFDEVFTPSPPPITVVPLRRPIGRARALALAAAALVLAALIGVVLSENEKPRPQRPPPATMPTNTTDYAVVPHTRTSFRPALSAVMIAGVSAIVLVIAVLAAIGVQELRRRRRQANREGEEPPYAWSLKAPRQPQLFGPGALLRLIRALKGREEGDRRRLHIRKTIAATIRADGDPRLVYQSELQIPDTIVLIERASDDDHQAVFFDRLIAALSAEGVAISRYFYEGDPRICWAESRRTRVHLRDLRARSPEARLLVFGDPQALLDPLSGEIHRGLTGELQWRRQIVASFAPVPRSVADKLRNRVEVVSGRDALERLADLLSDSGVPRAKPTSATAASLSGDAQRWLRACAAYPRLEWDLTLALGAAILGPGVAAVMPEIVPLPSFRGGVMKNAERLALVAELVKDPELETTARAVVSSLLLDADLPLGSFAARERNLQLLAQEIWLKRQSPTEFAAVYQRLRQYRTSEIGGDAALLRLLYAAPATRLLLHIPGRVRRLWFRSGIPALGHHDLTAVMAGMIVLLVLLGVTPWNRLPQTAQGEAVTETYTEYLPVPTTGLTGRDGISPAIAATATSDSTARSANNASAIETPATRPTTTGASIPSGQSEAGARKTADAAVSAALNSQVEALSAGGDRSESYGMAQRKLQDALAVLKAGENVRNFKQAARLAGQAGRMFHLVAEEAKTLKAVQAQPATSGPTPQPRQQPVASPCVWEASAVSEDSVKVDFGGSSCGGLLPEPAEVVEFVVDGKIACRATCAMSKTFIGFEQMSCKVISLYGYPSLSVRYRGNTVPMRLQQPTESDDLTIVARLAGLLAEREMVTANTRISDMRDYSEFLAAIEKEFRIQLDPNDVKASDTLARLFEVIQAKLAQVSVTLTFMTDKGQQLPGMTFDFDGGQSRPCCVSDLPVRVRPGT
ncbi:MAG: hypothetical protein QOH21_2999, partial [Acidobacteriota bacterium]|nr:hypothetical protein [Acidobacteriota bacterium]